MLVGHTISIVEYVYLEKKLELHIRYRTGSVYRIYFATCFLKETKL